MEDKGNDMTNEQLKRRLDQHLADFKAAIERAREIERKAGIWGGK